MQWGIAIWTFLIWRLDTILDVRGSNFNIISNSGTVVHVQHLAEISQYFPEIIAKKFLQMVAETLSYVGSDTWRQNNIPAKSGLLPEDRKLKKAEN